MPSHLADFAPQQQQQGPTGSSFRRPRVKVVDGRAFVYDVASAAALLSEHRIWATPVGVRHVVFRYEVDGVLFHIAAPLAGRLSVPSALLVTDIPSAGVFGIMER